MSEKPVIEPRRKGRSGTQTMLIPSEQMLVDKLRAAPAGRVSDLGEIRKLLAREFGADACCPVTIQRHMVALSEKSAAGLSDAPFWRVVDAARPFARRMVGGAEAVQNLQEAERLSGGLLDRRAAD